MNRYDKIVRNIGIGIFILMLGSSFILGGEATGPKPPKPPGGPQIFEDVELQKSTIADRSELRTGETFPFSVSEKDGVVIKNLTVKLSWTDESNPPGRPRVRRYENEPDSFSLLVRAPDGNSSDEQGTNPQGQSGLVETGLSMDDEHLADLYNKGIAGNGNWTIEVTLLSAGMWTPVLGPGVLGLTDAGNEFSISIDYEYYDLSPAEEGEE